MQILLWKCWKHIFNLLKNYRKDWFWWSSDSKRLFVRESPELESPAQYKLTYHPNIWDRAPGGGSGHAAFKLMKYGTTASNQCDDIGGQCPCLCGHQTHPTLTQKTVCPDFQLRIFWECPQVDHRNMYSFFKKLMQEWRSFVSFHWH